MHVHWWVTLRFNLRVYSCDPFLHWTPLYLSLCWYSVVSFRLIFLFFSSCVCEWMFYRGLQVHLAGSHTYQHSQLYIYIYIWSECTFTRHIFYCGIGISDWDTSGRGISLFIPLSFSLSLPPQCEVSSIQILPLTQSLFALSFSSSSSSSLFLFFPLFLFLLSLSQ